MLQIMTSLYAWRSMTLKINNDTKAGRNYGFKKNTEQTASSQWIPKQPKTSFHTDRLSHERWGRPLPPPLKTSGISRLVSDTQETSSTERRSNYESKFGPKCWVLSVQVWNIVLSGRWSDKWQNVCFLLLLEC